jgi:hypothetical protein
MEKTDGWIDLKPQMDSYSRFLAMTALITLFR